MPTKNYFTDKELACSHCGVNGMDEDFVGILNSLREASGFPWKITSGYRCAQHPVEAAKAEPGTGAHCTGLAVDVGVSRGQAFRVVQLALAAGIRRIGVNQKGQGRFIHLDMADDKLSPTIWSY